MVIAIFGESCVGKSTIADKLKDRIDALVYSGKDYLRLAKSEVVAKQEFEKMLATAETSDENIIYVISEKEHMAFIPKTAIRVLVTTDLDTIVERFGSRMHGNIPEPVKRMLAAKHGMFDNEACDYHIQSGIDSVDSLCEAIAQLCGK